MGGDLELTHKLLNEGVQIAQDNGLPLFAARLELSKIHSTDCEGRTAEALENLARLEPQFRQAPPLMRAFYAYDRAIVQLVQGDLSAAERDMQLSYDIVDQAGYVLAKSWLLAGMGEIHWAAGRFEEAGECVSRSRQVIAMLPMPIMEFDVALLSAAVALEKGQRSDAVRELHHALSVGRAQGLANGFHLASRILPRVVPYALEQGIEVDYCRWLIRQQGLRPPAIDVPGWPWSVRIEALGSFQVYVDEKPLRISGKAQRRPLNLLKALVLHQGGCEIDTLIDRYWSDLDGDAARNAFDLALHRLRKILLRKESIVLAQGRVRLNRSMVWVDAFALEAEADENYDPPPPVEQVRRLLQLYRGPLLAGESEPWTLAPRERLRGAFLRRVAQLSDLLQASHQYEALIDLNHRALDVEPLAEEVYRRLMQSLIAQDRHRRGAADLSPLRGSVDSEPQRDAVAFDATALCSLAEILKRRRRLPAIHAGSLYSGYASLDGYGAPGTVESTVTRTAVSGAGNCRDWSACDVKGIRGGPRVDLECERAGQVIRVLEVYLLGELDRVGGIQPVRIPGEGKMVQLVCV